MERYFSNRPCFRPTPSLALLANKQKPFAFFRVSCLRVLKTHCSFCHELTNEPKHPFTQENIKELKKLKTLYFFISPTNSGVLACNEVGQGKLPSVDEIIALVPTLRTPFNELSLKKKIVITTGATISPMDPVRYLSNLFLITGYHLAISALKKGYNVVVIAGRNAVKDLDLLKKHPSYQLEPLQQLVKCITRYMLKLKC